MTAHDSAAPLHLNEGERIGIVAGGGSLPVEIARRLVERGHRPFVLDIEGEAGRAASVDGVEAVSAALEEIGRFVEIMKANRVTHVLMAGAIGRRPRLSNVRWSFGLLKLLPTLVPALRRGDDGALRAAIGYFERNGLKIVGAHEIMPDLLAEEGVLTRAAPLDKDWRDIEAARAAALAIGALDIGQAAVAIGGRAVALEGVEGTDGLLERTVALRGHGRIAGKTRGVVAKCAKPGQDWRVDLPAIGPGTVERAHAAGLAGIAVEAGRTLFLERVQAIESADRLGIFIVGLDAEGRRP